MIVSPPKVSDFHTDLAFSETTTTEAFWIDAYQMAFPDLSHWEYCDDIYWQRQGVDRVLYFSSGHTAHIDEKTRRKKYPDILLEYISNDSTGAPGWIEKQLSIDFLAYAFLSTREVHLLPWQALRRTWIKHKDRWLNDSKYFKSIAKNRGYNTHSVAIPINELRKAVATSLSVRVPLPRN